MSEIAYELGKWLSKVREQIKYIKETKIEGYDDSVYYNPKVEMNKSLDEVEVTVKEKVRK